MSKGPCCWTIAYRIYEYDSYSALD